MNVLKFPKKTEKKQISVEEYREYYKNNPLAIPKKKVKNLISGNGDTPIKSKSMKAVIPENLLQKTCNEMIEAFGFSFIRFEDSFLRWISLNAPVHIRKMFFDQVGGKFPDVMIQAKLGDGFFLTTKLELKTEDKKGRAVGQLHGKQKNVAKNEEWMIARNAKQIESALQTIQKKVILVKKLFKGNDDGILQEVQSAETKGI
jgi:hypothetical protein